MSRVDLHIHSNKSDGAGSVAEILAAAAKKPELLAIAITDHNEISGALEAAKKAKKYGVEVIVGEEVSTTEGHIVGLFLNKKIARGLTPEKTIREIHAQGGVALIPHPYPHYRGIGMSVLENLVHSPRKEERPDALEVRNGYPPQLIFAREIRRVNAKAWHLPEVGNSDSHHPRSIGSCWTEFAGNSVEDFKKALLQGKTEARGNGWGVLETARVHVADARYKFRRRFED